jgi:alkanesulfonate monooxygenase SsuD/methylene tetrahydromethanopterin reductase-like flavin-dependent oxidoreductase (luciferase family)
VNLGLALGRDEAHVRRQEESLRLMFGPMTDFVRPGILVGTPPQVVERIRDYASAGAEWVILALRAPFDWDGLELFIQEVMPAFPD